MFYLDHVEQKGLFGTVLETARAEFAQFYQTTETNLLRFVRRKVSNTEIAQDLVSEIYLNAWRSWSKFKAKEGMSEEAARSAWLSRIAHNRVVNHYRDSSRHSTHSIDDTERPVVISDKNTVSNPDEAVSINLELENLKPALAKLNENQRGAIQLRFVQDLSFQEVGNELGINEGAAKALVHRALKIIRAEVAKDN